MYGMYGGRGVHVRSRPAVQTCCAPTRRQVHQPQHSARSGQRHHANHKADNGRNGARNRAANAIAQTSAQDELTVDFGKKRRPKIESPGALPKCEDRDFAPHHRAFCELQCAVAWDPSAPWNIHTRLTALRVFSVTRLISVPSSRRSRNSFSRLSLPLPRPLLATPAPGGCTGLDDVTLK